MSSPLTVGLGGRFARELPELAVPWQADSVEDPHLLVLNAMRIQKDCRR